VQRRSNLSKSEAGGSMCTDAMVDCAYMLSKTGDFSLPYYDDRHDARDTYVNHHMRSPLLTSADAAVAVALAPRKTSLRFSLV
jgi:hypothetical protein